MAKQAGDIKLRGTIQNITFYPIGEEYYARKKSSLDGKRFGRTLLLRGAGRVVSGWVEAAS